jgi:hypothetical protein
MIDNICWHVPEPYLVEKARGCNHRGQPCFSYGRCRSGKRWFWTVAPWFNRDNVDGWEDSEEAALAAARDVVRGLAGGQPAAAYLHHGNAYRRLQEINKAKRAARPAADTSEARAPEYLFAEHCYDPEFGETREWSIRAFPVVRKTAKRIY